MLYAKNPQKIYAKKMKIQRSQNYKIQYFFTATYLT